MKFLLYLSFLLLPGFCQADIFILQDGTRLEGELTGEMDGMLLVKTKYGSLTISKAEVQERQAAPALAAPAAVPPAAPVEISSAAPEAVMASTAAPAIELSTAQPEGLGISTAAPAVEISTALPEAVVGAAPKLTFNTVLPDTATIQLVYLENGAAVATETYDAAGALVLSEGTMSDGTYTEYYPDGGRKTARTMLSGKANGTVKAFFPGGALQIEASYLAGGKEGPFKYYTEDGKLLMEASYKNDLLNGWRKEYGADGAVSAETFYIDGRPAAPLKTQAAAEAAKEPVAEPGPAVTVRKTNLARGELFSFRLNGKYVGKTRLDRDYNLISREGKVPDGAVKVYTEDGSLEKELVFEKNVLKALRVYEPGGPLKAEYTYAADKAVKR